MNYKRYKHREQPQFSKSAGTADILNKRPLSYDDFLENFHSMKEDECDLWDLDYSISHYHFADCKITIAILNNTFWNQKKYSLISNIQPSGLELKEGKIHQIHPSIITSSLTKGYINKHKDDAYYAPEWCGALVTAGKQCVLDIIRHFPLSPNQIGIEPTDVISVNDIWIVIPDVCENKKLLIQAMKLYGYHLSYEENDMYRNGTYDTTWVILTFSPDFQETVTTHILNSDCRYLYHTSPKKFRGRILKYGLIPMSKNDKFNYSPRVYMVQERRLDVPPNHEEFNLDMNYIRNLAGGLLKAKLLIRNDEYVNDNIYVTYQIDLEKVQETVRFSYDPYMWPLAIFTSDNISPLALTPIDEFDASLY